MSPTTRIEHADADDDGDDDDDSEFVIQKVVVDSGTDSVLQTYGIQLLVAVAILALAYIQSNPFYAVVGFGLFVIPAAAWLIEHTNNFTLILLLNWAIKVFRVLFLAYCVWLLIVSILGK